MEQHIYFHIPKCGGSTLNSIVHREYSNKNYRFIHSGFTFKDLLDMDQQEREKLGLLGGIVKFGVHQFLGPDVKYFTVIRDPVSRILSLYNYIQLDKAEDLYKNIPYEHRKDLKSFVLNLDNNHTSLQGHNGQARLLSGNKVFDETWDTHLDNGYIEDNEMGAIAIENIKNQFAFIGTVEQFDASLVLMKKFLNWKKPLYYIKRNVTKNKEKNLDEETIELIKERNQEDIKLYEYVKDRLQLQIEENKSYVEKELRKLNFNKSTYKFYRDNIRSLLKKQRK